MFLILMTIPCIFLQLIYVAYVKLRPVPYKRPKAAELTEEEKKKREICVKKLLEIFDLKIPSDHYDYFHELAEFEDPMLYSIGKREIINVWALMRQMFNTPGHLVHDVVYQRDQAFVYSTSKWQIGSTVVELKTRYRVIFTGEERVQIIKYIDEWFGENSITNPNMNFLFRIIINFARRAQGILWGNYTVLKEEMYL